MDVRVVFHQSKYTGAVSVHCHTLPSISFLLTGFRDVIPNSPVPNILTLPHLVNNFHDTGSVQDRNCGWHSMLNGNNMYNIHQILLHFLRKPFYWSRLFYGSLWSVTKVLKVHISCGHAIHKPERPDTEQWLLYCRWFRHLIWGRV
jgi:hypothetical protein